MPLTSRTFSSRTTARNFRTRRRAAAPDSDSRSCSRSSPRTAAASKSNRNRAADRRSGCSSRGRNPTPPHPWRSSLRRRFRNSPSPRAVQTAPEIAMTKIMIVEDEAGLRQGLEINLRMENYETVLAADGEEAIRVFHAESPDIVLLDLMLPKKSGFEVLDHIRKFSKIPVILLTARGQETDKVRGLRGGADDYITKPFGLQELFARIDAVMRRSEAPAAAHKVVCDDELI